MTRDELIESVSRAILANSRPNADPDAFTPGPRGTVDFIPKWMLAQHLAVAAIDHPRIARALSLLDTIGNEAADALIAGWRPIEEVPKQPSMALLFMGNLFFTRSDGTRVDVPSPDSPYRDERYAVGFWDGEAWCELWTGHEFGDANPGDPRNLPTNWLPLFTPPAGRLDRGGA